MLGEILVSNVWVAILFLVFFSVLRNLSMFLYVKAVKNAPKRVYEYENENEILNFYSKDNRFRLLVNYLLKVFLYFFIIYLSMASYGFPIQVVALLIGMLLFADITISIVYVHSMVSIWFFNKYEMVEGKVVFKKNSLSFLLGSEMLTFSFLYFIIYFISNSFFVLGGALICFVVGSMKLLSFKKG